MLDFRDPDGVLLELRDAQRRFEKHAPAPIAIRELLFELVDEIADSGPLELGVSPRRWIRTQTRAHDFVGGQADPTSRQSTTSARGAIGRFRRLMRRIVWSRRWRVRTHGSPWAPAGLFTVCSVALAGVTVLVESAVHGGFAGRWLGPALLFVTIFFVVSMSSIWRSTEAASARRLAAKLAPNERCLFSCRMPGSQVLIATDQRILAGNPRSGRNRSRPLWSVPYAQITSVARAEKTNDRRVTLRAGQDVRVIELRVLGSESDGYDYQKYHQEALVMILRRRTHSDPTDTPAASPLA